MIDFNCDGESIKINYTNYKGVNSDRNITPWELWFGESKYHEGKQWFIKAYDLDRKVTRDFALNDLTILEES